MNNSRHSNHNRATALTKANKQSRPYDSCSERATATVQVLEPVSLDVYMYRSYWNKMNKIKKKATTKCNAKTPEKTQVKKTNGKASGQQAYLCSVYSVCRYR